MHSRARDRASTPSRREPSAAPVANRRGRGGQALWHDFLNFHGHFLAFPRTSQRSFSYASKFSARGARELACKGFGSAAAPTPTPSYSGVAPCFYLSQISSGLFISLFSFLFLSFPSLLLPRFFFSLFLSLPRHFLFPKASLRYALR